MTQAPAQPAGSNNQYSKESLYRTPFSILDIYNRTSPDISLSRRAANLEKTIHFSKKVFLNFRKIQFQRM